MQTLSANVPTESSTFAARTAAAFREQDIATREAEQADLRTRAARQAIKAISNLSEREACALIAELTRKIGSCGWSHCDHATDATESLTDAHAVLEAAAEVHA